MLIVCERSNTWKHQCSHPPTMKTNSRFTLRSAPIAPRHSTTAFISPLPFQSPSAFFPLYLPLQLVKAEASWKRRAAVLISGGGGESPQSNKHKLVSKAHHSPSRQTQLGGVSGEGDLTSMRRRGGGGDSLRQKRRQSLTIINERLLYSTEPQSKRRLWCSPGTFFAPSMLVFQVKLWAFSFRLISCDTPRGLSKLAAFRINHRRRQRGFWAGSLLH